MKAFQKAAGTARKRLFRRSVQHETKKLDASTRTALVQDVQAPAAALQQELQQLDEEISRARANLQQSEEKEVFLGQRSRQYRKALDERARQLKQEQTRLEELRQTANNNDADDEEMAAQVELDKQMEQWERDEDALTAVVETHKKILGHNETMRWKIKELQAKRKSIHAIMVECTDFLQAADTVRNEIDREAEQAVITQAAAAADDDDYEQEARQEEQLLDPMIQIILNENDNHHDNSSDEEEDTDNEETRKLESNV